MSHRWLRVLHALLRVWLGLLLLASACRTDFITMPDGSILICTVCGNMTWCNRG